MRVTDVFRECAQWFSPLPRINAIARARTLAVARFETVYFEHIGLGMLDLTFVDGAAIATIHGVSVETSTLTLREGSGIRWPVHIAAGVSQDVLEEIEAAVVPWLRTLVRGRVVAGESIRRFRPCDAFDAARRRGDFGATPLARSLPGIAPFVYARRFARNARIDLRCAHGARGVAVLRDLASALAWAESDTSRTWFGLDAPATLDRPADLIVVERPADAPSLGTVIVRSIEAGHPPNAGAGWRIVAIPEPVPIDYPFTFDEADAPAIGWFAVRGVDSVTRPRRNVDLAPLRRDSTGRIALWLRPDARQAPDADVDDARELARRLEEIGITATLCTSIDEVRAQRPDVVHVFAAHGAAEWQDAAPALRALRVPYVVSLEPLVAYTLWEETALSNIMNVVDIEIRGRFLDAYRRGQLEAGEGLVSRLEDPQQKARASVVMADLLGGAATVFTNDAAGDVRQRFGLAAQVVIETRGSLIAPEPPEDDVAGLVPSEPFVLVHAPLLIRNHQLSLIEPLRGRVPLVLAGAVSDVVYAGRLQRAAAGGAIVVADPPPGTVAALYRRAALFVEPSLRPIGFARVLRAAACGALPVVPARSPLAPRLTPEAATYDPLDGSDVRAHIEAALVDPARESRAASIATRCASLIDNEAAFRSILRAYAASAVSASR